MKHISLWGVIIGCLLMVGGYPLPSEAAAPESKKKESSSKILREAPEDLLAWASHYLTSLHTLTGRFTQIASDGRRSSGQISAQKPGLLHVQYDAPNTLEITADGRSVLIADKRLKTRDVYSIGQTPLKFLLKDTLDFTRDVRVLDVAKDNRGGFSITFNDTSTLGGTSRITLMFAPQKPNPLTQWVILDPQGYETTFRLSQVSTTKR
jgi:outer membrane lipoprotein-sorting protein